MEILESNRLFSNLIPPLTTSNKNDVTNYDISCGITKRGVKLFMPEFPVQRKSRPLKAVTSGSKLQSILNEHS